MRGRHPYSSIVAFALVFGCSIARAQPDPDAKAILKAVAEAYSNLQTYHFVSTTERVSGERSANPTKSVLNELLAGASNGRTRYALSTPVLTMTVVSDGQTSWIYFPQRNEYIQTAALTSPFPTAADLLSQFKLIDQLAREPTWLRAETLTVEGRKAECDVIRLAPNADEPMVPDADADRAWRAEWTTARTTYWIDRESHLILRSASVTDRGSTLETIYTIARMNQHVSPDLFEPVPPGARKVDRIQ